MFCCNISRCAGVCGPHGFWTDLLDALDLQELEAIITENVQVGPYGPRPISLHPHLIFAWWQSDPGR